MEGIKPDQERVKNLLLDTVTLLCKNSLQFENHLRVEGLLGVAVDDNDTFFLHISEHFKSDAYLEKLEREKEQERKEQEEKEAQAREAQAQEEERKRNEANAENLALKVKQENDNDSDGDLKITGTSNLQSPSSVARSAAMFAGQRRAQRRPHSSINRGSLQSSDNDQGNSFLQTDSQDGSYSTYDDTMKQEQWGDGEPPNKRQSISTSSPWPNLSGVESVLPHDTDESFQDSGTDQFGGGGDPSQPGCSAWPTDVGMSQDTVNPQLYTIAPKPEEPERPQSESPFSRVLQGQEKAGEERDSYRYVQDLNQTYLPYEQLRTHYGKRFRCFCGMTFSVAWSLDRHKDRQHRHREDGAQSIDQ